MILSGFLFVIGAVLALMVLALIMTILVAITEWN